MMRLKFSRGFTLVELMVTIAVMAIIASIAAPSFSEMIKSYQLNQSTEQMMLALKEGRSRAAATRSIVVVCPNKKGSDQEVTKKSCLTDAKVSSTAIDAYINENRVILANINKNEKLNVSGDISVIFNITGISVISASDLNPQSKVLEVCLDKKSSNISVSILGTVDMEKGTCA